MFTSILVALDDSACAQRALSIAIDLAHVHSAKLTLVSVVDPIEATAMALDPYNTIQPYLDELTLNARVLIAEAVTRVKCAGVPVDGLVLDGPPVAQIVDVATRDRADLIVIGSHGRKGITRLIAGSIAEGVTREAPCPTLIVHDKRMHRAA